MKRIMLLGCLSMLWLMPSCQPVQSTGSDNKAAQKDTQVAVQASRPVVGADKDKHDCIASAGYRWSALRNKCIRLFEEKVIRLVPAERNIPGHEVTIVLFNEPATAAEVFLPGEREGIVLERKNATDSTHWTNGELALSLEGSYILKRAGNTIFKEQ